ncbi:nucleotidyltransferase family protein [Candidatus Woesearchaeota archaeon]|nr:nucleotidyltransferase family protein [Candidatus Woesearchaeota archaeon]
MKGIILAGGEGTRLRPLTYNLPKALIQVQGKTLTEHVIDVLKKLDIDEVVLSIGYMADKIKEYFGDGSKFNLKITYAVEKEPMGTAGPLILLPKIDETFVMANGDNLFGLDFKKMLEQHKNSKATATIALTKVEDPSKFGAARLEGEKILEFIEKPKKDEAPSNYINSGYYILEPEVFDIVKGKDFAMMEKDVFPKLAKEGKLFGYKDNGQWFDTGTPENYEKVKKEWKGIE